MSEPFAKKTHRVEPKHIFLRKLFEIDKRIEPSFKAARRGGIFHDGEYSTDSLLSAGANAAMVLGSIVFTAMNFFGQKYVVFKK